MVVPATEIVTARLTLVPLTLDDLQDIFAIARCKESIEDYQYVAQHLDDVKGWLHQSFRDPNERDWTIRKGGAVIGFMEVYFGAEYSDAKEHVCRIGYFIDHNEQNQGYATEALHGAVHWLFDHTDVNRIEAGVTLHNVPSYRILEKVGFTRDKVVKGNWKWRDEAFDSVYYYLHRPGTG